MIKCGSGLAGTAFLMIAAQGSALWLFLAPPEKTWYTILQLSFERSALMRVIDLENINSAMQNETQFVLRCEEVFHDKISAAAASILSTRQERPVVA